MNGAADSGEEEQSKQQRAPIRRRRGAPRGRGRGGRGGNGKGDGGDGLKSDSPSGVSTYMEVNVCSSMLMRVKFLITMLV